MRTVRTNLSASWPWARVQESYDFGTFRPEHRVETGGEIRVPITRIRKLT